MNDKRIMTDEELLVHLVGPRCKEDTPGCTGCDLYYAYDNKNVSYILRSFYAQVEDESADLPELKDPYASPERKIK